MSEKITVKTKAKDISAFAGLITNRVGKLKTGSAKPLPETYAVNETAKALHPSEQKLVITKVIDRCPGTKSYVFKSAENKKLAYFRAGQYLSVKLKIGSSYITRPFSISSSPAAALKGEYMLTVREKSGGFASEYIIRNWKEGTTVSVSDPDGTFYYEPIRDAHTVVGAAGGSGITPFVSLAEAIADGTEDAELILLYGCRNSNEILFKEELDKLSSECDKIKVIYVLSDENADGCEQGFISAELIKKYAPEKYSLFVCGPGAMYEFLKQETEKLGLERKYIRFELFAGGKPEDIKLDVFNCKIYLRGGKSFVIPCRNDESILSAIEKSGLKAQSKCRSGECGFCRCKLVDGEIYVPEDGDGRRMADLKFGWIHPCCTYAKSDIVIRL